MPFRVVGETRLGKRVVFGLVGVLVVALMAGFLAGGMAGEVSPVHAAACKAANAGCSGGDTTMTSAMYVCHDTSPIYAGTSTVVEPDSGESWNITAYWNAAGIGWGCNENNETATVDVSWDGSSWSLSNVNTTSHIRNISICSGNTCDGGDTTHAWDYKLIVDITDPNAIGYNLRTVQYTTTSVDDGYTIEDPTETYGDCYTDTSVSPTSQSNTANDTPPGGYWGAGRCGFSCSVTGGSITLYCE